MAAELADAEAVLQAAKADQARDEAAEDAEDEKETRKAKDVIGTLGALYELVESLRDGNGLAPTEELHKFIQAEKSKLESTAKRRKQSRNAPTVIIHELASDDDDGDLTAMEDGGFTSAREELAEEPWELVRGRGRKRLPPPPRTPPSEAAEAADTQMVQQIQDKLPEEAVPGRKEARSRSPRG